MSLQIGIVGLPNVGKSTLFNALTKSKAAEAQNYPFCTIDPNVGIVTVPDKRLDKLTELVKPEKVIPTVIEFVDIAGLVKGASQGEGLGNQFLAHIRECDAVVQVIRLFEDDDVIHVDGKLNPKSDLETIITELVLSDLEAAEKRALKLKKMTKSGDKVAQEKLEVVLKVRDGLADGTMALHIPMTEDDQEFLKDLFLLTNKPFLYIANVSEDALASFDVLKNKRDMNLQDNDLLIPISASIESELIELSIDEQSDYMQELGISESGLNQLIRSAYEKLGLITFFTAGEKEVRAWTVKKGATAPQAAGVIHTDFEHGFICAETIAYDDYVKAGTETKAKEMGLLRKEGKNYIVQDGDVFHFRFNV